MKTLTDTLTNLCEGIYDCPHTTAVDEGSGYPLIRTPNVGRGRLILEGVHRVSEEVYIQRNKRATPKEGDLIFAREAPAGNVALIEKNQHVCLGQRTVLIRPDRTKVDPSFLTYFLLSAPVQYDLLGMANGATVAHVNLPVIRGLKVTIPSSLEEQRKVAHVLSAYDTLIENNRKQIKLLEEAARRLYKEWFVDLRFPGHEHTPIVNGIPEGWRRGTLHDMADMVFGQSPKSDYYNKRGMGLPFHQGVASYGDRFVVDSVYTTKYSKAANPGSILFSVRAPVGRLNITRKQIAIGRGIAALNHKNGAQSFLYYLLKDYFHKEDIVGNGAIFASVSGDELRRFPIILPSDETIDRFNAVAKCYDEKIEIVNKQNELLTEARDRLLPKLMSGEITIK